MVACLAVADSAYAYSQFTADGGTRLHWTPARVRWMVTDRGAPGVTQSQLQAALARAFQTWQDVPTASVAFEFAGFTSADPGEDDNLSVVGFQDHPELERVLGATSFVFDEDTGELVEADIYFNSQFEWSTAASGDASRFDLESVALHEIGHFLGLGHSGIGETEMRPDGGRRVLGSAAVMFPIALGRGSIADRMLQPDDIAGVSDLYPDGNFTATTGGVHGRVRHGTAGARGAHVIAFDLRTQVLVGGFATGAGGEFQILGLKPGAYVLRVEPLDDADVESFFSSENIDVDFQVTYYQRVVAVPAGGVGPAVDVAVRPK
jgi:hypothetical protein